MDVETLAAHRDNPAALAALLTPEDIAQLVPLLTEKDDKVRYPAFLILCERSKTHPDAYPYWDVFAAKLGDENSFQRNIGASLIGYNVRWDTDKKFKDVFRRFTRLFTDEKPITARLALQTIPTWAEYVPELLTDTVSILTALDLMAFSESMRKLILTDILNALIAIRTVRPSDTITDYLMNAMTGGLLDKKTKKQFEAMI